MIEIGQIIANREVYSIHENFYCIAKSVVPSPEPFTVWNIDVDGSGVHTGRYFKEKMDAEWCYAGLCFEWFEDNVHINMIEDKTASDVEANMELLTTTNRLEIILAVKSELASELSGLYSEKTINKYKDLENMFLEIIAAESKLYSSLHT